MKVDLNKLEGLTHKLSFAVPAEKVREVFDKNYRELQKDLTIKGFRKGKAPLNLIRHQYADRVKQDVLKNLISDCYQLGLEQHHLDPIGYPQVRFDDFEEDKEFHFSAEFEIRPEINLKKYEGLQLKKAKLEVGEEQIEKILKEIQNNHAEFLPILEDRVAQVGDIAEVAFEGFVDGQPLEGGKSEQHMLELGSKQFIEGFEEGVIGMRPGVTNELHLRFPSNYHRSEIADKPVLFKVTLNSIKKKNLLELNDELAQKAGSKDLQSLKEDIRKELETELKEKMMNDLRDQVLKALVEENPVEVPKSLQQQQKELIIEDVKKRFERQGLSEAEFAQYKEKWDDDFNQSAHFMVQSSFLVDTLAHQLSLRPSHQDLHEKISQIAQQTGLDEKKLSEYYHKPDHLSRLSFQMMEERVVSYLIEKANIVQVD